jgi:hypothetical protein
MNDSVEECQTDGVGRRLWGCAIAITVLLMATSCGRAARDDLDAPPALEPSPYSLWLSAERVNVNQPTELVAALVNHDGVDATFGVFATIDRWDGRVWRPYRELLMCLSGWNCGDDPQRVGGDIAITDIGLSAKQGSVGTPQRFTTEGLSRGWYRITQHAHEDIVARAIFEVATDADPLAPLDPTDQPAISVTPVVVSPEGATVELGPLLPSTGGTTRDDVEHAVEGMEEVISVEQWDGEAWHPVGAITLHSSLVDELVRDADVPALTAGEYRFVRGGPNGSHSGRFWVADLGE